MSLRRLVIVRSVLPFPLTVDLKKREAAQSTIVFSQGSISVVIDRSMTMEINGYFCNLPRCETLLFELSVFLNPLMRESKRRGRKRHFEFLLTKVFGSKSRII